jgi:hypothetical protein
MHQWLSTAKTSEGLIFIGVSSSGVITDGLCESCTSSIYKTLARKSRLSKSVVNRISGHSMCARGTKYLLKVGAGLPQIMAKGSLAKTDTVMGYLDRVRPEVTQHLPTELAI